VARGRLEREALDDSTDARAGPAESTAGASGAETPVGQSVVHPRSATAVDPFDLFAGRNTAVPGTPAGTASSAVGAPAPQPARDVPRDAPRTRSTDEDEEILLTFYRRHDPGRASLGTVRHIIEMFKSAAAAGAVGDGRSWREHMYESFERKRGVRLTDMRLPV
jgi:hypothetical protein